MPSKRYTPDRGDVVWIDFDPQAGSEQAGRRPALVLSPELYNGKTGLMICAPITNIVKGYPFEVEIPPGCAGVSGVVLADHLKNLDWRARNAIKKCEAPDEVVDAVLKRLRTLLN